MFIIVGAAVLNALAGTICILRMDESGLDDERIKTVELIARSDSNLFKETCVDV